MQWKKKVLCLYLQRKVKLPRLPRKWPPGMHFGEYLGKIKTSNIAKIQFLRRLILVLPFQNRRCQTSASARRRPRQTFRQTWTKSFASELVGEKSSRKSCTTRVEIKRNTFDLIVISYQQTKDYVTLENIRPWPVISSYHRLKIEKGAEDREQQFLINYFSSLCESCSKLPSPFRMRRRPLAYRVSWRPSLNKVFMDPSGYSRL